MADTSTAPLEHATGHSLCYAACRCDLCESKRQAIERLVDSFSHLSSDWMAKIAPDLPLPMWGMLFVPKDPCDARNLEKLLRPIEDDIDELYGFPWQEVGDTGIYAAEVDDELVLGIHGAGYSFHAEHWSKLYDALGYHWHEGFLRDVRRREALQAAAALYAEEYETDQEINGGDLVEAFGAWRAAYRDVL